MASRRILILRTQPGFADLIADRENALRVPLHALQAVHACAWSNHAIVAESVANRAAHRERAS